MKIIAIDPGSESSALVVWDGTRVEYKMLAPNDEVRGWIKSCAFAASAHSINPGPPLVIEMIGHYGTGMPAGKTVFDTCVFIGRCIEAYGEERTTVMLRPTVKAHICGSARAKDGNVIQALKDRFGDKGTVKQKGVAFGMKQDLWQAWALAVAWWDINVGPKPERKPVEGIEFEELGTR